MRGSGSPGVAGGATFPPPASGRVSEGVRRGSALVLSLLALAAPAWAETAPVRSGEHVDFSRLVVDADASTGWSFGRVDGGYEFRATRGDFDFGLSEVFDLIPRTRIAEVSQPRPSALFLAVSCDCHADAFELRGGRVAIDIKDGPPLRPGGFETPLEPPAAPDAAAPAADAPAVAAENPEPTPAAELAPAHETVPPEVAEGADPPPAEPIPAAQAEPAEVVEVPLPVVPALVPGLPGSPFDGDVQAAQRARGFEEILLDQLARAGAQGLVEPLPAVPEPAAPDAAANPAPEPAPPPEPAAAGDHIRVETAADRDRVDDSIAAGLPDSACIADERLDLAAWGHLADGRPDIAVFRDGLSGEFDDIDSEKAVKLARYYLFLTFGAEAAEQLRLVAADAPDRALLLAMATAIDRTGPGPWIAPFQGLEACPTAAAMWALLSGPPLEPEAPADEPAILKSFSNLPEHAKRYLGPRLIDALRAAGRAEAAEIVRNRMDLAGAGAEVEAAVAGARLDGSLGRQDEAEAGIADVLHEVDPDSPEALLALAETRLTAGDSIDDDLLTALESVSFNLKDTDIGRRIDRAIAEAHLSRGEWATARDLALGTVGAADHDAAADLVRRVYKGASADADGEAFLRLTLPEPAGLGSEPRDAPARLAVADRLLGLGFPDDALAVLGPLAEGPQEARLLAGRAHLAARRADQAIAAFSQLDGTAALLAAAHEQAGRFDLARTLYQQAGAAEDAGRMSLRLADWADLAGRGEAPLHDAAARLAEPPPEPAPDAGPQRLAGDLIARSEADRAAFGRLLGGP